MTFFLKHKFQIISNYTVMVSQCITGGFSTQFYISHNTCMEVHSFTCIHIAICSQSGMAASRQLISNKMVTCHCMGLIGEPTYAL